MKKIVSILSCAVALVAVVQSCSKENISSQEGAMTGWHTVNFVVEAPAAKTAISVDTLAHTASYTWKNTPDTYVYLFENGTQGTDASIKINDTETKATLSARFEGCGLEDWKYTYTSVIASSFENSVVTLPSVQHPGVSSYDPAADILLGKSEEYLGRHHGYIFDPVDLASDVKLKFARAEAVTRIVFTGLSAGEKVDMVRITCGNEIAGPLNPLIDCQFQGYDKANGTKTVTLEFFENNEVAADGTFETYFTSWAVAPSSFDIVVATDACMYSKSAAVGDYTLELDVLNNLRVDMKGCDIPSNRFELVTEAPQYWDGTYIIVDSGKEGAAKALSATAKSNGTMDVTVRKYGGTLFIGSDDDVKKIAWDISDAGKEWEEEPLWNVMTRSDWWLISVPYYLYDKDGLTVSMINYTGIYPRKYFHHLFSLKEDGVQAASLHDGVKTYMKYDGSLFTYDGNSSNRIFLYRYVETGRESQHLSFDSELVNWTVAEGKYEIGKTYDGQPFSESSSYSKELLSYSSSDPSVASVDNEGRITINRTGEVTITAIAASTDEYSGATASYVLRIYIPHYQRIVCEEELSGGEKYLIVAKVSILGDWYHALNAADPDSYNYAVNTVFSSNPVYDDGMKIEPSEDLNANQIILEQSKVTSWLGKYLIRPICVDKYMYCDTQSVTPAGVEIPYPTYGIAFTDAVSGLAQLTTVPHTITFNEDGTVSILSGFDASGLGGTLFFSKISGKFAYVNLLAGENDDADKGTTFIADMYLYKYID